MIIELGDKLVIRFISGGVVGDQAALVRRDAAEARQKLGGYIRGWRRVLCRVDRVRGQTVDAERRLQDLGSAAMRAADANAVQSPASMAAFGTLALVNGPIHLRRGLPPGDRAGEQ